MEKFIKKMSKALDYVEKAQIFLGCCVLCLFILMVAYQIIARFTATPAHFTEDISNTAFIWTAFMGAPVMLRRYEHYRFTGISEKFTGKLFWINEFFCICLLIILSLVMTVHGYQLTVMFKDWGFSSMSKVSKAWLWLCMPISGATSLLYCIETMIKFLLDPSTRAIKNVADQLLEEAE